VRKGKIEKGHKEKVKGKGEGKREEGEEETRRIEGTKIKAYMKCYEHL